MSTSYPYSSLSGMAPPVFHDSLLDEPLIKLVDQTIKDAILQEVSDIHIEPFDSTCRIRYRRDGILYEATRIPSHLAVRFITRLKVMAKLDITERRLPQDGRFQLYEIDIRMNTCPTLFGEKVVLRLLNSNKSSLDISTLGLSDEQKKLFLDHITRPHGMIIMTGPTGSGKTFTLYAALNYLNTIEKNISTAEDPIEIQLDGINQININSKIGLEFSTVLRTLLRQDPDIIMLGEIRDEETARIAIQAAQTGHLVLATLHTNNAIEALTRLHSMGISLHDLVTSISLIVSQRLLRKLCPHCKKLGTNHNYVSHGCTECLNGYQGRTGIYEFFPMTDHLSELVLMNHFTAIRQLMKNEGFSTLFESGMKLLQQGITSMEELKRILI